MTPTDPNKAMLVSEDHLNLLKQYILFDNAGRTKMYIGAV